MANIGEQAVLNISIHALREEGDLAELCVSFNPSIISIHALREEGDCLPSADVDRMQEFLSTPSVRRATDEAEYWALDAKISIHALREEGDLYGHDRWMAEIGFLSTPSVRRATSWA